MFLNLNLKIKNWLEKLRALPDSQKKVILWAVVGVVGTGMAFFWITGAVNSLSNIGEDIGQISFPEINVLEIPVFPGLSDTALDWNVQIKNESGVYANNVYNYQIDYSAGTVINENTSKSCVILAYETGYIAIKTFDSKDLCLRTSASAEAKNISQIIKIGEKNYEATGIIDGSSKYLQFSLPNGEIDVGFETDSSDIQAQIKIMKMISSFKIVN